MTEPYVIHIEIATPPGAVPRLWVPYHGPTALAAATLTPYRDAVAALTAQGMDPARLIAKRRRGVDRNEWCYPLAEAVELVLENEQPPQQN